MAKLMFVAVKPGFPLVVEQDGAAEYYALLAEYYAQNGYKVEILKGLEESSREA